MLARIVDLWLYLHASYTMINRPMRITKKVVFVIIAGLAVGITTPISAQTPTQKLSILVSATVQASPASITLAWPVYSGATGYSVFRKLRSGTSWGSSISSPSGTSTGYTDSGISAGNLYEYKVQRSASTGTAYGYVCSGITTPATEYNGRLVLLVDNSVSAALATELTQLETDLKADGWSVVRHDVSPASTVPSVRNLVITDYNADPTNTKAVYVVGHVPVPYSGDVAPDGHDGQHMGAWPADGYYGEMNGTWTDNTVNDVTGWPANVNVPGDGKFDQSNFPSTVELQVGRVDFNDLPTFTNTVVQRLSFYLTKAHQFKIKAYTPVTRAIIFDHLTDIQEPLAGSAFMTFAGLVGASNITDVPYSTVPFLQEQVNNQSYLWTYGSGGGLLGNDNGTLTFYYTDKIATTPAMAGSQQWGGVFNMMFGSYVGDWNGRDDVMRAMLANGKALTNVYAGQPNWFFHTMSMGENIGSSVRLSMNNSTLYLPQNGGSVSTGPNIAMGLLGDPSLHAFNLAPPIGLVVSNSGGNAAFSWGASEDAPDGYHVYKLNATGVPTRVNTNLITGTSYTSTQTFVSGTQYMVRAVKVQNPASGSFTNLSLGALATAQVTSNVVVAPRVLLEGPYNSGTGLMTDGLRTAGLIPLNEPYTALGFAQAAGGGGESTTQTVLNVTGNNAIVDWVRVELRSSGAPATVVATRQALLQRDGDVVSTDGTSALSFGVGTGSYYVAVRHRNHLGAMTANALSLSGSSTTVDLKATTLSTYGTAALNTIGTVRALWAGNVVPNTELRYTGTGNDRDPILTRIGSTVPTNTVSGYYPEDVTLDGTVKYTGTGNDRDLILVNIGATVPTNTRLEQLP